MKESIKKIWAFESAIKSIHNEIEREGQKMGEEAKMMQDMLLGESNDLSHETGKVLEQSQNEQEHTQQFADTIRFSQSQREGKEQLQEMKKEEQKKEQEEKQEQANKTDATPTPTPSPPGA